MKSSIFSKEIQHFCETTSVRGIPRIINSRTLVHRVLWFLGVITCAAVLIWQICVLFNRFLSFPVNTLFVKSPDYDNATFPDITICNLYPLVNHKENILSYRDYLQVLGESFILENFKKNVKNKSEYIFYQIDDDLSSPDAYFINFPMTKVRSGSNHKFPILDCNYFDWYYKKSVNNSNPYCSARIEEIWDPDYYTCYTLKLPDTERKYIRGFAAIIYVEDYEYSVLKTYALDLRRNRATGMQVLVHAPGTKPNMKLGMSVGPRLSTAIAMDQTKVSHLPYPYSHCTTQQTLDAAMNDSTSYTKPYCIDVCIQKQYMKKCNCIESTLQFTFKQLEEMDFRICGNLSIQNINESLRWEGINEIICVKDFVPDESKCQNECVTPCEELQYSTSINAAPWPHISAQISVYDTYRTKNPAFGKEFDRYNDARALAFSNVSGSHDILVKLDREGAMKNVLLQLNIKMNTPTYNDLDETVGYPLDEFGAQIGGTLAVWLGVTIIVVFEIIEFFVNLLYAGYQHKRNGRAISKKNCGLKAVACNILTG